MTQSQYATRSATVLALGTACAGCLAVIAFNLASPSVHVRTPARSAPVDEASATFEVNAARDGVGEEARARPIFHTDRRAFAAPAEPSGEERETLSGYAMVGSLVTNSVQRALLSNDARGVSAWVSPGEEFLGWTVEEVGPDRVVLSGEGGETVLALSTGSNEED